VVRVNDNPNMDEDKFRAYAALAMQAARDLAQYQSPKLSAVAVGQVTKLTVIVKGGLPPGGSRRCRRRHPQRWPRLCPPPRLRAESPGRTHSRTQSGPEDGLAARVGMQGSRRPIVLGRRLCWPLCRQGPSSTAGDGGYAGRDEITSDSTCIYGGLHRP
jgi:hypothetical protein